MATFHNWVGSLHNLADSPRTAVWAPSCTAGGTERVISVVMIIIYRDNYHCGALLLRLLSTVLLGDESAELLGHIGALHVGLDRAALG